MLTGGRNQHLVAVPLRLTQISSEVMLLLVCLYQVPFKKQQGLGLVTYFLNLLQNKCTVCSLQNAILESKSSYQ